MKHIALRLVVGGIVLILVSAACLPQPSLTPIPPTRLPGTLQKIDEYLSKMSEDGTFNGTALIAQGKTILFSKGYGWAVREQKIPNTPQTRFRIASITKQFTAMAILILQTQRRLQVQDLICNYVSDCPAVWQAITIHHLLTHTSGILNYTFLSTYDSTYITSSSHEEIMALFKHLPLGFHPGEKWSYSNSGYIVLGYIIEHVSGQSYESFLHQFIFTPLNMRDTGVTHNSNGLAAGYADGSSRYSVDWNSDGADGSLYSTAQDLYLWDQALYTEQLVPQALLDQMLAPHADPDSGPLAYGYGWFVGEFQGRLVALHPGVEPGASTIIARYQNEKVVIIVLSNQRKTDLLEIAADLANRILDDK